MSIDHPVVLLPSLGDSNAQTAALQAALADVAPVLTPDISISDSAVILEDPALKVLAAMSAVGTDRVVLLGRGWGTMVALQLAASHGERVAALMLSTNARLETILLRSIYLGVLSALPANLAQLLGARPREVRDLLDQARPVDFRSLAERVQAPALVVVGERDVANRGPSAALAKSLPLGNLRVVPRAGAGWQAQQSDLIAQLLIDFVSSST
jgi:pimeloyl-ACP methyl ester carboxylesterase